MRGDRLRQAEPLSRHGADLAAGLPGVRSCVSACDAEALARERLGSMAGHEAHHRGQLYLMASMRGLAVPPLFGLRKEEVFARPSDAPSLARKEDCRRARHL